MTLLSTGFPWCVVLIIWMSFGCDGQNEQPSPNGNWEQDVIVDYDYSFSPSELVKLGQEVIKLNKEHDIHLVINTTDSYFQFNSIEDYAYAKSDDFGLSNHQRDRGLLIVLSFSKGEAYVLYRRGLEDVLTPDVCSSVIIHDMVEYFERYEYCLGVLKGIEIIDSILSETHA